MSGKLGHTKITIIPNSQAVKVILNLETLTNITGLELFNPLLNKIFAEMQFQIMMVRTIMRKKHLPTILKSTSALSSAVSD